MENIVTQLKRRSQRDYSHSFKLQVVSEIERGEISRTQARKKYGIQGNTTVLVWLRKYCSFDWKELPTMLLKKTPEQRIKELEALLALEKEKVQVLNIAIDIADEMFDIDIRKKYTPKQLKKRKL